MITRTTEYAQHVWGWWFLIAPSCTGKVQYNASCFEQQTRPHTLFYFGLKCRDLNETPDSSSKFFLLQSQNLWPESSLLSWEESVSVCCRLYCTSKNLGRSFHSSQRKIITPGIKFVLSHPHTVRIIHQKWILISTHGFSRTKLVYLNENVKFHFTHEAQ